MAVTVSNATNLWHLPRRSNGSGQVPVLCLHGIGGDHNRWAQGSSQFGSYAPYMTDRGAACYAPDLGTTGWPNATVMGTITTAYNTLIAVTGGTTVRIFANSGGSGAAIAWMLSNAAKVTKAWLNNPLTDQDWAYGLAGYTPSYATGGVTRDSSWAAQLDTAFSGNYATNVTSPYRIHDQAAAFGALGVRTMIAQASDDTTLPPAAAPAFVTAANNANVTLRSPTPTGGHTNLGSTAIPLAEIDTFLRSP